MSRSLWLRSTREGTRPLPSLPSESVLVLVDEGAWHRAWRCVVSRILSRPVFFKMDQSSFAGQSNACVEEHAVSSANDSPL